MRDPVTPADEAQDARAVDGPGSGRVPPNRRGPSLPPILDRRSLLAVATIAVATSVVGALIVQSSGPAGRPSPTTGTSTGSPAPRSDPSSAVPDVGWTSIDLPAMARVAVLAPTDSDAAGIGLGTRFTLTSAGSADARTLAAGLSSDPPVTLSVARNATSRRATLVPSAPLAEGTRYRFALRVRGEVVGSWQFQTRQRLAVSESIPSDRATDVPIDTGIELTFNQDGAGSIAPFFTIRPAVSGTFERHGRAWVFVPEQLVPTTIYTVTLQKGVPVTGSDLVLEDDLRFSFETAPKTATKPTVGTRDRPLPPLRVDFPRSVLEVVPGEPPVLDLWVEPPGSHDTRPVTTRVALRVYSLPDASTATSAIARLTGMSDWASWSDAGLVATRPLSLVASFTAPIKTLGEEAGARDYVEFPTLLAPGWYLVDRPSAGRNAQLVLQVTDVATHITFTSTRSVVWVNDVTAGGPIAGAAVRTTDGHLLGRTDAAGIAVLALDPSTSLLIAAPDAGDVPSDPLPGRAAIVPVGAGSTGLGYEGDTGGGYEYGVPTDRDSYWHVLDTDRSIYRSTDEIDAWGMIRARSGGKIPAAMRVRLVVAELSASDGVGLRLPDLLVHPDVRTGAYTARLPVADLPGGDYIVETRIGSKTVGARYVRIGQIQKPAYRLDVSLDRSAVVEGDPLTATVRATFFDGTPVPSLDLRVASIDGELGARTDADGRATITSRPRWGEPDRDGPRWRSINVYPGGGEEADISASAGFAVLPSRLVVAGEATISGATLAISGSVHALDAESADGAARVGGDVSDAWVGRPVSDQPVRLRVTDEWDVRIKTGRRYDPITKRAYDTFRYESREAVLRDVEIRTAADGSLKTAVALAAPGGTLPDDHDYEVTLSATDTNGRTMQVRTFAFAPARRTTARWSADATELPLELGGDLTETTYPLGGSVELPLTYGGATPGADGAFLYVAAHAGLRSVEASAEPVYRTTFASADMPSMTVRAVWFTGRTYVTAPPYEAIVDRADRSLRVEVLPDRATHRPGEAVALRLRTTDAAGRPVAASVVVRAIDEKLYAIGAAGAEDPYEALFRPIDSGLLDPYSSHPAPRTTLRRSWWGGQGGDTCGGGDGFGPLLARDDFRDVVLFRSVRTAADGTATVRFDLSDDLTSWRISAAAFSAGPKVGQTAISLPVGMPLFVEVPVAAEYVATDRPVLRLRAYGTQLRSGDAVTFTLSAPSLGMSATTVRGSAFTAVAVQLPPLVAGDHAVRIVATSDGARRYRDALVRTIHVVSSRLTQQRSAYSLLTTSVPRPTAVGGVTYVFLDAGRGKYLDALREIAGGWSDRLDAQLAATLAADLLDTEFGLGAAAFAPPFVAGRFLHPNVGVEGWPRGFALLPYGSADLALTARIALVDPETIRRASADQYLDESFASRASTREQRLIALAGLAGLASLGSGWDLTAKLEAALAADDLSVREHLYLGLAAAHLHDYASARTIERDLLARYGQRLGPWVRLSLGDAALNAEATSLLTLLALELGDPIATSTEAFVEENPSPDDLAILQRVAFLRHALRAAPATAARFEYRLAGKRHAVTLSAGQSIRVDVPSWQLATFTARRLAGSVGVSVSWVSAATPAQLPSDPSLILERTSVPSSAVPVGGVVTVVLTPRFGDYVMSGCYRVEDIAPSGLVPVREARGGLARGKEDDAPVAIEGQHVTFCATPSSPQHRLIYYARVVGPGDYAWEPATMRSERALENGTNTGPARLVMP
jgi:hypothetical protein